MTAQTRDREGPMVAPAASPSHEAARPAANVIGAPPSEFGSGATGVHRHFLHRGVGAEFSMEVGWMLHHVPSPARRIVDVGCGNGALFDSIGPQRVLGVDPNIDGLRHSTRRHPGVAFLCADGARLPLADESVDVVTAQHVIEHIADYQQAVAEWFRVLRPGGRLILVTPNGEFADPSVFADDSHVCILDRSALRRTVATAGFDILETCTLGLPWFRDYHRLPSVWRLRRFVTGRAHALAAVPPWRWKGQTLCCAAARPG